MYTSEKMSTFNYTYIDNKLNKIQNTSESNINLMNCLQIWPPIGLLEQIFCVHPR